MDSRRLAISALLCDTDDTPPYQTNKHSQQSASQPPPPPPRSVIDHHLIVPEPVVLAPHLRGNNSRPGTAHRDPPLKDIGSKSRAQREDPASSRSHFSINNTTEPHTHEHSSSRDSTDRERDARRGNLFEDGLASRLVNSHSVATVSARTHEYPPTHRTAPVSSQFHPSNPSQTSYPSNDTRRHGDIRSALPPMKHAPPDTGILSSPGYMRSGSDLDPSPPYQHQQSNWNASAPQVRSVLGFDALVHAASEERRKIASDRPERSSSSSSLSSSPFPAPIAEHQPRMQYSNSHDPLPGSSLQQPTRRGPAFLNSQHIKRSISEDTSPRRYSTLVEPGRGPTQTSTLSATHDKEYHTNPSRHRHSDALVSLDSHVTRGDYPTLDSRPGSSPHTSRSHSNVYKDLSSEQPPSFSHQNGHRSDPTQRTQARDVRSDALGTRANSDSNGHSLTRLLVPEEAQRPNKKRRRSSSPSRVYNSGRISPSNYNDDDAERTRLKRDRKRMETGELGFGRAPVAPKPGTNSPTQRPAESKSFHLLSEHEGSAVHPRSLAAADRPAVTPRQVHPPPARRLPPGSSTGRVIAAKKLLDDGGVEARVQTKNIDISVRSPSSAETSLASRDDTGDKRLESVGVDNTQERSFKEEDADDWFLKQFDEAAESERRRRPSHEPAFISERHLSGSVPIITAAKLKLSVSPPPPPAEPTSATAMSDVEQELVEAIGISEDVKMPGNSMPEATVEADVVDLAVAEALGEDTVMNDANAEVDNELLRLVDDQSASSHRLSSARASLGADHSSRPESPSGYAPSQTSTPDRESMPPPANMDASKTGKKVATTKGAKKPRAKPKPKTDATGAPPKPRARPKAKSKLSDVHTPPQTTPSVTYTSSGRLSKASAPPVPTTVVQPIPTASSSRSRSTSVLPSAPEEAVEPPKAEGTATIAMEEEVDDKLYCICKTSYDEEKVMIACDRCDEWYHTQCVRIPDVEVDLVDQFICPPCVRKNPELSLETTYKARCLNGLRDPNPASASACHKPVHAFSKYCSEACGLMSMRNRIQQWKAEGGRTRDLWERVEDAEQREGVIFIVDENDPNKLIPEKPERTRAEREAERLNGLLENVLKLREELKAGLDMIEWRAELLRLASERAAGVGNCGWDQRLCYGEKEFEEDGEAVLSSYEQDATPNDMDVDGYGQWWCSGEQKCGRHYEWQKIRRKDIELEHDAKDAALANLTLKEREIRKRIEDNLDAQSQLKFKDPFKTAKKVNGEAKKGKKRKSAAVA